MDYLQINQAIEFWMSVGVVALCLVFVISTVVYLIIEGYREVYKNGKK